MAKIQPKQTNKLLNGVFIFFLILVVGVTNIRYGLVLDKELEPRVWALAMFMLAVVIFPLLFKKRAFTKADFKILKSPFVYFYAAYLLITGISIFVSQNTAEAVHEFLKTFTFFILFLYLVLFILPKENSKEFFLKAFIIFSLIVSAIGVIQIIQIFPEHGFGVKAAYLIKGNFAHKNMFSQILFFSFTFATYSIYVFKDSWRKAAFIGSLLNLFLIAAIMTRSVWLAVIAAFAASTLIYFIALRKKSDKPLLSKKMLIILGSVVGVAFLAIVVFAQLDKKDTLKKHVTSTVDFKKGSTFHRLNIWKKSGTIFKEHPIIGVGAGNWKVEVLKYDVVLFNKGWKVPRRTHNDYISVITETGILGMISYLSMFVLMLVYTIRIMKRQEGNEDKLFSLALFFAIIGYMTFSFFSFSKERIESQIILNTIFAFVFYLHYELKGEQNKVSSTNKLIKPIILLAAVVLVFTAYSATKRIQAEIAVNKMYGLVKNKKSGDRVFALVHDLRSPFVSLTPMSDPFLLLTAEAMLNSGKDKQKVIEKYKEALDDCPYHVKAIIELAYVYSREGNNEKAIEYSKTAFEYAPSNIRAVSSYAYYLDEAGNSKEAFELMKTIKPKTKDPKFRKLMTNMLLKKAQLLNENSESPNLSQEIVKIAKKQERIYKIYRRSVEQEITFEKLLLTKAMNHIRKKNKELADSLKSPLFEQYGLTGKPEK